MISWRASWPWLHILGPFHRVPCIRWNHAADGQTVTGKFLQHEAVQMADWSTVTLVPGMRFSSCPSIRGSHWLKFASRPAKSKQDLWSLGTQNIKKVKEMTGRDGESFSPRWRCRKASVALLERSMAISGSISPFSFISFPIQLPVRKVKSGKLWWTVPLMKDRSSKKTTQICTQPTKLRRLHFHLTSRLPVPDGDHFPLYAGRVQLLHAADVPRPLELLWVDEEDRLLHPCKDLVV